jgi:Cu/Ag efflux protein CusF
LRYRGITFGIALGCLWLAQIAAFSQQADQTAGRIMGEVTAVDAANKKITLKSDKGQTTSIALSDSTRFLRVPPGEKDLKNATTIALSDIATGDRVLARGKLSEDQKNLEAVALYVMTRADLAKKQQHDREEWQRRGISGTVTAVNAEAKQVTVSVRTHEGVKPVLVNLGASAQLRRYAPDSVRFGDAKPSSLAEVKTGDQIRALGERNEDGNTMAAEEVVFGTFRNIAATVKLVNSAAGELQITDLDSKKPVMVKVNQDAMLRKMPPMMAAMLARRVNPATTGGPSGPGEGARPAGAPGGPPAESSMRPGGRGGNMDFQQLLERMPVATLGELNPGDALIISSTAGMDPGRVTAITIVAGVEPLLASAPPRGQSLGGTWNFGDIPLPQ